VSPEVDRAGRCRSANPAGVAPGKLLDHFPRLA